MSEEARPAVLETIEWSYRVPLLTSRFMLWDSLRVTLISVLGMYVLGALMGLVVEGAFIVLPLQVFVIVMSILLGLFVLASLLLGDSAPMTFSVHDEGVRPSEGTA